MVMDFKAIEEFWFGDLPENPFPLGPNEQEEIMLVAPLEEPINDNAPRAEGADRS